MDKEYISPVRPGTYLKELWDELGVSQYRLAKDIGMPAMRINYVVNGKRSVNAELALLEFNSQELRPFILNSTYSG